ncbi:hypothetical protein C8Q70DRAFT_994701 [Cubamyces menziesii]|nr:hypothetical protein C8Q70DRAFT_994701 [Cubamyces menziesii]
MGLAYTSAPASTAPVEREFSMGRTQINWNQESMSSQTFRAKMCVAAWSSAPWYDEDVATQIIADNSRPLRPSSSASA